MLLRYFFILLLSIQLYAEQSFEFFIDEQLKTQTQLDLPQLSDANKTALTNAQEEDYKEFLLDHATSSQQKLSDSNVYMLNVSKLNIKINANVEAGYHNAVLRDKLTLENMKIRQDLAQFFSDVLSKINDVPLREVDAVINDEVVTYLSTYIPVDTTAYKQFAKDAGQNDVLVQLQDALRERKNLDYVSITFCTEVITNGNSIYNVMHYSKYGFLMLVKKVEGSAFGAKLDDSLVNYNLSAALLLLITLLFLMILILLLLMRMVGHVFLSRNLPVPEDRDFINAQVSRPIETIVILLALQFVLYVTLGIGGIPGWLSQVFGIAYVLLITLLFYRMSSSVLLVQFSPRIQKKLFRKEILNLIVGLNKVLIIILALIAILSILGVNLSTMLGGLGLGGAAIAFAAKDSISNIFGSISLLASDVFDQGDWIQVGEIEGTVVQIGLRATTIRTFANALISVPNLILANDGVINWDRRKIGRQIKMYVGVPYSSDFDTVDKAIKEIREMLLTHPDITGAHTTYVDDRRQGLVSKDDKNGVKRTLLVYLDSFSDSGMEIMVYCFSRSVIWEEWLGVKEDVLFKVGRILHQNGLEIAYPTRTLHQNSSANVLLPDKEMPASQENLSDIAPKGER